MPPKGSNADTTVTHPLQAVVLADSFTRTFRPMSLERPKVLMPIANSPMIEYTLEMLANAKVKEIIVVCCWHAAQVAEYLKQSRWGSSKNPVVRVLSFPRADSAGTALRELADTSIIQSDPFILISGDVVSNVRLGPILRAHIAREDKNKIMTMVFRKTNPGNPLRNFDDDLVVAMDAESKQLLLYEVDEGVPDEDADGEISLKLGKEARFFVEHPKLEVRHDLLDCHIDICSPEMFQVLQGEFYEDLRLGMVRKEVASPEFQHNFYVHELTMPQDYAARVHCIRSYDQVTKDVIGRWLYPLTPDNNWSTRDGTCWLTRGFMYREAGVALDRTAKIGRCTMLGADSTVGEGAQIESTVLGRRVTVGAKAKIEGSYIWDGAIIGAGADIDRAVICNDAVIGDGAKIMRGAIVSFGVTVEPNEVVLPFTRLTKADPYVDDRGSWDGGSEDMGPAGTGENVLMSSADATTGGNIQKNSPSFQIGQETEAKPVSRIYTMEEEDFDSPEIPAWASQALDEATGIWKVSKALVIGSMGCEELEKAKENRSWFTTPSRGSRTDSLPQTELDGKPGQGGRGSTRNVKSYPSMGEESLPSQVAHLLSGFLTRESSSLTESYFQDQCMELRGLRASRALCSFEEILSVTFAVLLQGVLADVRSMTPAQIKEKLVAFVTRTAPLLSNFTKKILNQEEAIQFGLIQSAEMCCLIGPNLAPEVLMDLPAADYRLERALGSDNLEPILKEHQQLQEFFPLLVLLFVSKNIIELPALQKWKSERVKQMSTIGDSKFLDMYKASEKRIDAIIGKLVQQAQEEEEESEEGSEEDDDE